MHICESFESVASPKISNDVPLRLHLVLFCVHDGRRYRIREQHQSNERFFRRRIQLVDQRHRSSGRRMERMREYDEIGVGENRSQRQRAYSRREMDVDALASVGQRMDLRRDERSAGRVEDNRRRRHVQVSKLLHVYRTKHPSF